jgi:hypothetical protein
VSVDQRDWADYMSRAVFSYNSAMHPTTKESPFGVAYGTNLLQLINITLQRVQLNSRVQPKWCGLG